MHWKDVVKKGLKAGIKTAAKVNEKGSVIADIIRSSLHADLIRGGAILIPEALIREEIETVLADQKGVELTALECREDGIHFSASLKTFMAATRADAVLKIETGEIGRHRQVVSFFIADEKVMGSRFLGKIAAAVVKVILNDMLRAGLSKTDTAGVILTSEDGRRITADIAHLPQIEQLLAPMPGFSVCILDVVSFTIRHGDGGIVVASSISDRIKGMKSGISRYLNEIREAYREGRHSEHQK